jgi:integrase
MSYKIGVFPQGSGRLRWLVGGVEYKRPRQETYTLLACFEDYITEHCLPTGGDPQRAWIAFYAWIAALGHDRECATLTRADGRKVVECELARGVSSATARKHLTMGNAALNHAKREERIAKVPKFQSPAAAQPRLRWLTKEEHRRLMLLPKPRARQLFWLLAFGTGARTGAILDLEWSRVDLTRRTIDYRVPGVTYKNKRRAVVFIHDSLLPRLVSAHARRDESCPFVVTRKGKRYSQGSLYHECKADLAAIGIKERGVARHVARHTVATWMLRGDPERGIRPAPIHRVAMMLGDTITMIEKNYAHVLPTDLQDDTRVLH